MAEGFVERDLSGGLAAGELTREDLADFAGDVGVIDEAGLFGIEKLGALGECAFAGVRDEAGLGDEVDVDFRRAGVGGADGVDVCAGADVVEEEDGIVGSGDGGDDVSLLGGLGDGGVGGGGDLELFA